MDAIRKYRLLKVLNMSSLPTAFKDYMYNMVKEMIEYREKNNVVRKDFIQCLIQLRNTGKVNIDDSLWGSETAADDLKSLTIEQCAAQVALLYLAGFDTTASAVANTLYELAQNPDLMKRLQRDIDETLDRHNGVISYEAVQEITLLDLCVQGKWMPAAFTYHRVVRHALAEIIKWVGRGRGRREMENGEENDAKVLVKSPDFCHRRWKYIGKVYRSKWKSRGPFVEPALIQWIC